MRILILMPTTNTEHPADSLARRAARLLPSTAEYFPGRAAFALIFAERLYLIVATGRAAGARNGRATLLASAARLYRIGGRADLALGASMLCAAIMNTDLEIDNATAIGFDC